MNENKKKDLRNAGPEQLAGLLKDLLDLDAPGSDSEPNLIPDSKDIASTSHRLSEDQEERKLEK